MSDEHITSRIHVRNNLDLPTNKGFPWASHQPSPLPSSRSTPRSQRWSPDATLQRSLLNGLSQRWAPFPPSLTDPPFLSDICSPKRQSLFPMPVLSLLLREIHLRVLHFQFVFRKQNCMLIHRERQEMSSYTHIFHSNWTLNTIFKRWIIFSLLHTSIKSRLCTNLLLCDCLSSLRLPDYMCTWLISL